MCVQTAILYTFLREKTQDSEIMIFGKSLLIGDKSWYDSDNEENEVHFMKRNDIPQQYKWKMEDLYATNDAWEADDGSYTREEFVERKQMYNARIAKLEEQIKVMEESKPEPIDYQEKITTLHAMIDTINNPDTPGAEKNRFLKQFIDRITYDVIDNGPCKGGTPILEVFLK